jgi:hypothetical protein
MNAENTGRAKKKRRKWEKEETGAAKQKRNRGGERRMSFLSSEIQVGRFSNSNCAPSSGFPDFPLSMTSAGF